MKLRERAPVRWLEHAVGRRGADSQVTPRERACLIRHAAGRRRLVEIGVMHGVTTALLRSVMDLRGTITGIDPHPAGRLGVSFERLIALREIGRPRRGRAVLLRKLSHEAAVAWTGQIDFLFIDGDHSWQGIEQDWLAWTRFLVPDGIVALHDSRSVPTRPDLDSVRYTEQVVLRDERFRLVETVESLTILARRREPSSA